MTPGPEHHGATVIVAWLSAGAVLLSACTTSNPTASPTPTPPVSSHITQATIRVHVRLVYSHPADGTETRYDGPMAGEQVDASGTAGRATATTTKGGWAELHVRPGSYAVHAADPCGPPSSVDSTPSGSVTVHLTCVAP